jgi:uncharacterized repeat protein (TIGR03803 family)
MKRLGNLSVVRAAIIALTVLLIPGAWATTQYKTLFAFTVGNDDGIRPLGGLVFDQAGNLYGTTTSGGAHGGGTVFELTANNSGTWTASVLHSFKGSDGGYPAAGLIFDQAGNLYGTTAEGGSSGGGQSLS